MRKARMLLPAAVCLLCMTACSGEKIETGELAEGDTQESQAPDLNLFFSGENTVWISAIEDLCSAFSKEYPQYTLEVEYSSGDDYTEELKAKEALDEFPDIFEIEDPYMFEEADMLGAIDGEIGELVEQPIMDDGKICALPFYGTSYGIIYNQVIFKEYGLSVPNTYGEFLELCGQLKNLGITPLAVGGSESSADQGWINYFFLKDVETGRSTWIQDRISGKVSFQDPDVTEALTEFRDLMTGEYVLEDSINMGDTQIISYMIDQKVAMYYGTPAMLAKIWEAYPRAMDSDKTPLGEELENDTVQIRPGWFYMPDDSGTRIVMEQTGSIWAASKTCMGLPTKKKAADTFLKFCYRTENYRKVLQAMYGMPVTNDGVLYAAPAVQQNVIIDYRYADRISRYLGNMETPASFRGDMQETVHSLASNTIEVGTAARQLDEKWNEAEKEQAE